MKNNNKINTFSDLIDNDDFIDWILNPTNEKDKYWNSLQTDNPELSEYIKSLRTIIENVELEKKKLSSEEKLSIWNSITNHREREYRKSLFRKRIIQAVSAAAILLLVIGTILFFRQGKQSANIDYHSMISQSNELKQSENIALILDNEKQVEINSNNAEVVYNNNGDIIINSEPVKEQKETTKSSINQLIVPYGKTTSLTLSDGSRIWINSGSKLIYPSVFTEDKREIYIQGEAYLEVAKDNKPFIVKSKHLDVKVLGTQFNISAYKDDETQSVVLVSGSVSVDNNLLKDTHKIKPNQMYSFGVKTEKADILNVDPNIYTSWKSGFLIIRNEKLEVVLNKLQRFYNLSFAYDSNQMKDIKVGGKLDLKDNIEDVLRIISITAPIEYEINDKTIKIKASDTTKK